MEFFVCARAHSFIRTGHCNTFLSSKNHLYVLTCSNNPIEVERFRVVRIAVRINDLLKTVQRDRPQYKKQLFQRLALTSSTARWMNRRGGERTENERVQSKSTLYSGDLTGSKQLQLDTLLSLTYSTEPPHLPTFPYRKAIAWNMAMKYGTDEQWLIYKQPQFLTQTAEI